jgi:hypothetical protein
MFYLDLKEIFNFDPRSMISSIWIFFLKKCEGKTTGVWFEPTQTIVFSQKEFFSILIIAMGSGSIPGAANFFSTFFQNLFDCLVKNVQKYDLCQKNNFAEEIFLKFFFGISIFLMFLKQNIKIFFSKICSLCKNQNCPRQKKELTRSFCSSYLDYYKKQDFK